MHRLELDTGPRVPPRAVRRIRQNGHRMQEPLSPELALIDPELAARARAALPEPGSFGRRPSRPAARPVEPIAPAPAATAATESTRPYPVWARVTAALWLLVLGILIGGAAIPHAQDTPRVLPPSEDSAAICKPKPQPTGPTLPPAVGSPLRPGS
jgi:hypothetical protein